MTMKPKTNNYQRKIKTREELREVIGTRPRTRKVIMCMARSTLSILDTFGT